MRLRITLAAILFAGLVQASFAGIVTNGSFAISGTVYVTDITGRVTPAGTCAAGSQCIFWQSGATTTLLRADISTSGLPSGSGVGLIPTSIAGNDAAILTNLSNPPNLVDGVGFTDQTFLTFNPATGSGITTALMLNFIAAGIYSPAACSANPALAAVGQVCTLPGSLFNFVNNPGLQATATWVFDGVTSGNPNPQEIWTGNLSSQFSFPFQTVLANLSANGYVSNTYSGTITLGPNPAPEPGSLIMIGTGMIGLAVLLRRRRAAK